VSQFVQMPTQLSDMIYCGESSSEMKASGGGSGRHHAAINSTTATALTATAKVGPAADLHVDLSVASAWTLHKRLTYPEEWKKTQAASRRNSSMGGKDLEGIVPDLENSKKDGIISSNSSVNSVGIIPSGQSLSSSCEALLMLAHPDGRQEKNEEKKADGKIASPLSLIQINNPSASSTPDTTGSQTKGSTTSRSSKGHVPIAADVVLNNIVPDRELEELEEIIRTGAKRVADEVEYDDDDYYNIFGSSREKMLRTDGMHTLS
jgi:hypothetical protein